MQKNDFDRKYFYSRIEKYGGCRQVVKTSVCGTDIHGFEPHHPPH